jgi:hypothetical protein
MVAISQHAASADGADALDALGRGCGQAEAPEEGGGGGALRVREAHFTAAQSRVGASVVRGLTAEAPITSWDDIGGMARVKLRLRQASPHLAKPIRAGPSQMVMCREAKAESDPGRAGERREAARDVAQHGSM